MRDRSPSRPRRSLTDPVGVRHPHPTTMPLVPAALALPLLPWALAATVAVPWMASVDGLIVNGDAVLRSHPVDLLPAWAAWGTAAGVLISLLIGWGAAVRIVADTLGGHTPRLGTAFAASARRLHLSLITVGATAGFLYAVDAALLALAPDASAPTRYLVGAAVFTPLSLTWWPAIAVHADDRGTSAFWDLRGRALLTAPDQIPWVALSTLTGAVAVFGLAQAETALSAAVVGAVSLVLGTAAVGSLTFAFAAVRDHNAEAAPTVARTSTAVVCAASVLVTLVVPGVLAQRLLDNGPWPTLSVERSTETFGDLGSGLSLTSDGEHLLIPEPQTVCNLATGECESPDPEEMSEGRDGFGLAAWAGGDGELARAVDVPGGQEEDHPPGTVSLVDVCLPGQDCERGGPRVVEPETWVEGEWDADRDDPEEHRAVAGWQEHLSLWADRSGGHDLIVTALPVEPFSDRTLLGLVTCATEGCSSPVSVPLAVLGGDQLRLLDGEEDDVAPDLIGAAMSEDGRVAVTVHDPWTGGITLHTCEDRTCGEPDSTVLVGPSNATVASAREAGIGAQVEFGPDGTPVIVFADADDGSVRMVDCHDGSCSASDTVDLAGPSPERPSPALALDSEGLPQVAFHDPVSQSQALVSCGDLSCSDHERVQLGGPDSDPPPVLLHMDPEDRPHVVTGAVESLRCTDPHCKG